MSKRQGKPAYMPKNPHPSVEKSVINVRRSGSNAIKIDFTEATKGIGMIHVYYAGKFVKTIRLNLTEDMGVI